MERQSLPPPPNETRSTVSGRDVSGDVVSLSCATCRRRKVRCDKQPAPCGPCVRACRECVYRPREARPRRQPKANINDVAARLSELESTIKVSPKSRNSAASATVASETGHDENDGQGGEILLEGGSSSQYFNEVLVTRLMKNEQDARAALESPIEEEQQSPAAGPFNPIGVLSRRCSAASVASFHPSKMAAVNLWKTYVHRFDSIQKVVHLPSAEVVVFTAINDPSASSMEALALCFAIYYAAAVTLGPDQDDADDSDASSPCLDVDWGTSLDLFKMGLEQALAHADFLENPTLMLIQALAIYLTALRAHNSGRAIWILMEMTITAARSIGLHRDGSKLSLSPFEAEMRRRVWWFLLSRDGRASEDFGVDSAQVMARNSLEGPNLPLNVEDADIYPGMKELPPPRPTWTRMTTLLFNLAAGRCWARMRMALQTHPSRHGRDQAVREFQECADDLLQPCNLLIPEHRWTLMPARFIVRKVDFISRQQWDAMHNPNDQLALATEQNLDEATAVLRLAQDISRDELLGPVRWQMRSYHQYHLWLYILWHVCVRPETSMAQAAFNEVDRDMDASESNMRDNLRGPKWRILKLMRDKASCKLSRYSEQETSPAVSQSMAAELADISTMESSGYSDVPLYDVLDVPDWSSLIHGFLQGEVPYTLTMQQ